MSDPERGLLERKIREAPYLRKYHDIGKFIWPLRVQLGILVVLTIICAFFEAISLAALVPLLQMIESQQNPGGTLWGILEAAFSSLGIDLNFMTLLALITCLFIIGQFLLYTKKVLQVNLRVTLAKNMKVHAFREILSADITYHHSQKVGNYLNLTVTEIENASYGLFAATEYLSDLFFIFVYTIILLYISAVITAIVAAISIISFYLMNFVLRRSTIYGKQLVDINMKQNEFLSERFNLLRLIKTSSTEAGETDLFTRLSEDFRNRHARYGINGMSIEVLFQSFIFIIAVIVLIISIVVLQIQLAMLLLFLFVLVRITTPLRDINSRRHELAREIPSFAKFSQILSEVASQRKVKDGTRSFTGFSREIALENVSFSYDGKIPVLTDINLKIPKNRMVALVGASGGGKSTIADLITRLIDPDRGAVLIDGVDVREYTLNSYRRRLGVVSQESYIFNDSVLANICYGAEEISPERATEAAKVANAHDFIVQLPDGYNTVLGERGAKLSGGQKQRIALARALYKNPEILILDEATSSLDSESEKIIQNSINQIHEKYTIIAIAHRLSTIENADRIYVIEKGRLLESGTHWELVNSGGYYSRYYAMQYGGERSQPDREER